MNETSGPDALTASDWKKLADWFADPNRKPAITTFTQGAARDAATAFEFAEGLKEKKD